MPDFDPEGITERIILTPLAKAYSPDGATRALVQYRDEVVLMCAMHLRSIGHDDAADDLEPLIGNPYEEEPK